MSYAAKLHEEGTRPNMQHVDVLQTGWFHMRMIICPVTFSCPQNCNELRSQEVPSALTHPDQPDGVCGLLGEDAGQGHMVHVAYDNMIYYVCIFKYVR